MERDRRRDRDVTSSSHTVQGVNVPLNDFIKLAPPTFTGMNSLEDPQRFLDDIWRRCEVLGCTDHRAVSLASFRLEGEWQSLGLSLERRQDQQRLSGHGRSLTPCS